MARLSIIMGVYNCSKTLSKSIESILNQSYDDWQLIICDDGSEDDTYRIAEEFRQKYPNKIILLCNEDNHGLHYSLNKCLERIDNSEFIARMDGDDICHKDRFRYQIDYLVSHPDISILGTQAFYFDDKGVWGKAQVCEEPKKTDIFIGNSFIHPSVMMRSVSLLAVEGYTVSQLTIRDEDYDLWCKMYYFGYRGANLNQCLLYYREDKESYSRRKYRYRVNLSCLMLKWFRVLKPGVKYLVYVIKPLLVGLIPTKIMQWIRKRRFTKIKKEIV